jgi:C-terminal processing protease CtpA/Prc
VTINNELPSPSYQGSEGTHSSADPHAAPSNGSPASDAHVFFKPNKETTCGIALGVKTKIAELTKSRHGVGLSLDANNLVTKVGSKAARDGVMVGDRIVAIDGEVISADKPAAGILKGIAVGSTVQLKLLGERAAVVVNAVEPDGIAGTCGLKVGHEVISINDEPVTSHQHGTRLLKAAQGEVKISVAGSAGSSSGSQAIEESTHRLNTNSYLSRHRGTRASQLVGDAWLSGRLLAQDNVESTKDVPDSPCDEPTSPRYLSIGQMSSSDL